MTTDTEQTTDVAEQGGTMSYDAFLAFASDKHAEWVNGEVIVFMPPKTIHQDIAGFLIALLRFYTELFNLGKVFPAPFEMRARPDGPSREPDILFIAREHLDRLTAERLTGPADLVVEIISQESAARDRSDKFYEYQEAGVREYWIIDPRPGKQRTDFYHLQADGKYQAALPDNDGWYHAAVLPNFRLQVAWLWQEPLPEALDALATMRGLSSDNLRSLRQLLTGESAK